MDSDKWTLARERVVTEWVYKMIGRAMRAGMRPGDEWEVGAYGIRADEITECLKTEKLEDVFSFRLVPAHHYWLRWKE